MPYEKRWTGDRGETSLRTGARTVKYAPRIEALGAIDELNSFVGVAIADSTDQQITSFLEDVQRDLMAIGADLSAPLYEKIDRITAQRNLDLESSIKTIDTKLDDLKNFILPGGTRLGAMLHVCRTVCRRAERHTAELAAHESVNEEIPKYLNRLSDVFFQLARLENKRQNRQEKLWKG